MQMLIALSKSVHLKYTFLFVNKSVPVANTKSAMNISVVNELIKVSILNQVGPYHKLSSRKLAKVSGI